MLETWFAISLMFAAMTRPLNGTLMAVEPKQLMVNADRQFQTLTVEKRVAVDRETTFAGAAPTTTRIHLSDLTPGEYVRLQIDAQGRVRHVRAVADVQRLKVRSVNGGSVVLEDGTTLTIGSVLRFVTERGKPSATATVRPGQSVLVFRHPQSRNIYRFSAEPRVRKRVASSKE